MRGHTQSPIHDEVWSVFPNTSSPPPREEESHPGVRAISRLTSEVGSRVLSCAHKAPRNEMQCPRLGNSGLQRETALSWMGARGWVWRGVTCPAAVSPPPPPRQPTTTVCLSAMRVRKRNVSCLCVIVSTQCLSPLFCCGFFVSTAEEGEPLERGHVFFLCPEERVREEGFIDSLLFHEFPTSA